MQKEMITTELGRIWPGWELGDFLGSGLGGRVYKAVRRVNGIVMDSAVKIIAAPKSVSNEDVEFYKSKADDGINEIKCLLKLRDCSQVVHLEDFALIKRDDDVKWDVYIRMELLRSLTDYLAEKQRLREDEIVKLGLDFSKALMQFEKNAIVQRDIKLENVFISEEGNYKLGDFGIAVMQESFISTRKRGNQNYKAPESFWEGRYGKATDIYCLGILMYMLANGNVMPFFHSEYKAADDREIEQAFHRRMHGEKIPDTRYASKGLNRIILKAVSYKPEDRYPNAKALYEDLKEIQEK